MTATPTALTTDAAPTHPARRARGTAVRALSATRRTPAGRIIERPTLTASEPRTEWDRMRFRPRLSHEDPQGRGRTHEPAPTTMPDPDRSAASIVQAACEVLTGHRPADQLARWTTPELFEALARRAGLARRLLGPRPQASRMRARSVRTQAVTRGACEATVLLDDGSRVRAAAARLVAHRGRWVLSHLEIA
ncbi:MAG: Rv3235 family protein [Actinomyces sp.]|uniref:Rv3235 family protein n=1 Tax=Actinomyces sp. TaxID=29317 RepID=UPI0026DB2D3D|nr:Rv3235 family protein [Actinomyces sp.]MDO4242276.1 Rv3235 family protein [Actinomyces sp.]